MSAIYCVPSSLSFLFVHALSRDGPSSRACSMFDSIDSTRIESSREFLLENSSRTEEFCSRRRVEQGSMFDRDRIESSPIKPCSIDVRLEMLDSKRLHEYFRVGANLIPEQRPSRVTTLQESHFDERASALLDSGDFKVPCSRVRALFVNTCPSLTAPPFNNTQNMTVAAHACCTTH